VGRVDAISGRARKSTTLAGIAGIAAAAIVCAASCGASPVSPTTSSPAGAGASQAAFLQGKGDIVDARQTATLSFDTAPPIGSQVTVLVSIYNIDPPTGLIRDNNGHAYVRDVHASPNEPAASKDGGVAIYRAKVTANSATPFTVTLDNSPNAAAADSWFTWAIANHRGQDPANPLEAIAADGGFETQSPSPGTLTAASSDYIAFSVLSKRAHANDTISPPAGWTAIINNPENSAHQSGAAAYYIGRAPGPIATTWTLANTDSPSFRCVAAIYKSATAAVTATATTPRE